MSTANRCPPILEGDARYTRAGTLWAIERARTTETLNAAERKAALGKAPVWVYRFEWESPAFGGRLKSPHSMDVPFVFNTLGAINEGHRKPGDQDLADRVSATWATFARNGDPANKSIPAWPAYGADNNDKRTTMVFNDDCKVVADPDGEVRPVWSSIATS